MKLSRQVLLLAAVVGCLTCSQSAADIFTYVDENGNVSFTDDPNKIPSGQDKTKKIRRSTQHEEVNSTETSFSLVDNHILVPVAIRYRDREIKGEFVFDTGAATSLISPKIATQLEINPKEAEVAIIRGVGGVSVVGAVVVDSISIGPVTANKVEVPVASIGTYDGLLGNDVLKTSAFQIDYPARLIRWH